MIREMIIKLAEGNIGREIPKPQAKEPFLLKGMGLRRGEEALIYKIPSHTRKKPYEKGITISEFKKAYAELNKTAELTRGWFNDELPACAKEGSCNFTTVGGVFEMLGLARYIELGKYEATHS